MPKTALVVSGGGSKGAFAVGAIRYMVEKRKLAFNIVSGTSTGAVIAPLVVAQAFDTLEDIYSNLKTADVLKRNSYLAIALRRVRSRYDTKPLECLIEHRLSQDIATKVLSSTTVQMFLTTVCLQTGRIVYFQTGPKGTTDESATEIQVIQDREHLKRAILASTNQPVLMPPIEVEPGAIPLAEYVDGGVREYAPVQITVDNGATEIYAVVLSPEPDSRTPQPGKFRKIEKILLRTISLLSEEVGENDLWIHEREMAFATFLEQVRQLMLRRKLPEGEVNALFDDPRNPAYRVKSAHLHLIRPKQELPTDGLDCDPTVMRKMIEMGRERAQEVLG